MTISADDVRDAAFLAQAAYYETSVALRSSLVSRGWTPLGAAELGLSPTLFGADKLDTDYLYNRSNAEGFVAIKDDTAVI